MLKYFVLNFRRFRSFTISSTFKLIHKFCFYPLTQKKKEKHISPYVNKEYIEDQKYESYTLRDFQACF
jgi:hypothetical protein